MNSFIETGNPQCGEADTISISELRQSITLERFAAAFEEFMRKAEEKMKVGKEIPSVFSQANLKGLACLSAHYGQGAVSKAPYLNWHVLSIYYIVDEGIIVIGIQRHRYPHLSKMKPLRDKIVPGKQEVAVFYSTIIERIDYPAMYEKFMGIAEQIIRLGMD